MGEYLLLEKKKKYSPSRQLLILKLKSENQTNKQELDL